MDKIEEWKHFKNEKIAKWLEPIRLDERSCKTADDAYTRFLEKIRADAKEKEEKGEKIDPWKLIDSPERKRGFRGQKWVDEMLFDFETVPHNLFWRDDMPDIAVWAFGNLETKTTPIGENYVHIRKGAWEMHPSTYLIVLKTCDEALETFRFIGWLYGHEVYNLTIIGWGEAYKEPYYYADLLDLNGPRKFLNMIIEYSTKNPCPR